MHFSELGYQVFAGVRRETDAASLIEEDRFSNIQPRMLDVTKPEQLNAVIGDLEDQLDSGLDALVNNAGISPSGPLEFVQVDKVRETFDVNCIGPLKLVQALMPLIRKANGRIILLGSLAGGIAAPMVGGYSMSKHALEAMADSLRRELSSTNVKVSLLRAGAVATPMLKTVTEESVLTSLAEMDSNAQKYYGNSARAFARGANKSASRAVQPVEVARAIQRAVETANPKPRYIVTTEARIALFLRWLLPDRVMDSFVAAQMK